MHGYTTVGRGPVLCDLTSGIALMPETPAFAGVTVGEGPF